MPPHCGNFGFATDLINAAIDESDDDSNNIMAGLQERTRDNSSSEEESACNHDHADHNPEAIFKSVPSSINMYPLMSEWNNDKNDDVDYDGDNDDDVVVSDVNAHHGIFRSYCIHGFKNRYRT